MRITRLNKLAFLILTFVCAAGLAFYFENSYREIIRQLYSSLTHHKISFANPGKTFHFASGLFMSSFGLYAACILYFLGLQTNRQKLVNGLLTFIIFPLTIILYCYIDGSIKLIECTACDDGTSILTYSQIRYDKIFVLSLFISLMPILLTDLKRRILAARTYSVKVTTQKRT